MEAQVVTQLLNAAAGAQWAVFAGVLLMILVWVFRKIIGNRLSSKWIPLVNAGAAVVIAISASLAAGVRWYEAIASGLIVGGAAGGFWSLLGRYVLPLPKKPSKPADPENPGR